MTRHDEELGRRVGEELGQRAREVRGHPLSLADVKRRATRIRRRRQAAAGAVAAVVLAVAVPAGLSVTDTFDRGERPGPAQTPSVLPAPSPDRPARVLLTTRVDDRGDRPSVPYLYLGAIHLPDGGTLALDGDYDGLVPLGDGWVVTGSDEQAERFVAFLDSTGAETASEPLADGSGLAVSEDGTVVAYGTPDGRIVARTSAGQSVELDAGPVAQPGPVAVAASGGECTAASLCTVLFNDPVGGSEAWATVAGSSAETVPLVQATDLSGERVAGYSARNDDGSVCSAVVDGSGRRLWQTCQHALGRFSPDGSHVVGWPAYGDGAGPGSLALLDARTGDVLATYSNDARTQAYLNNAVWETDSTLLATVFEKGGWSLVRMGVDGRLEKVMDLEGGDDVRPSLFLPAGR